MTATAKPCESGFTLVEMLVALVIFAILSAAGVAVLRGSVDSQAAVHSRLTQIGGLGRLHSLLASDLGQAADRPTRGPSGGRPAFVGDPNQMQFVRSGWTNLDGEPRSDLQRLQWRFSGETFDRTGFQQLDGGDEGSPAAPFARGIASASLRYRLADGSWTSSFRSSERMAFPAAVELTLTAIEGPPVVMLFLLPQSGAPQAEEQPL